MARYRFAAIIVGAAVAAARPSHAQGAGDGFLFHVPKGSWGVQGGFNHALAGGDVFAFVTDELTLSRRDFSSASLGTNFAIHATPTLQFVFDVGYAKVARRSEFRDWVDQNDLPIEQTTSFKRIPVTVSLKHYLAAPGRAIGRFAWVPSPRSAYVGLGAGMMWYSFNQVGDFVDHETLNVFSDEFASSGWTPMAQAFAGIDVSLGRWFVLNGEARFTWAQGPLSADFVGFNRIDLSGLSISSGLAVRF